MIGSGDLPPFRQSRSAADRRAFADPDLHPAPPSVYVATSAKVYNEVFMWGPRNVRRGGPDVLRNVVASNRKVPLTPIEIALGLTAGPARGAAAVANLRPFSLPGTRARIGFATSLPAFVWGSPPAGVNPCTDTSLYYMRCLNRLGANLVIQDEANPGAWTGPDGNGVEQWQPLAWMNSTYRTVSDPSVHFAYNVTAMMVGNLVGPRVRRTERDHPARACREAPGMPLHRRCRVRLLGGPGRVPVVRRARSRTSWRWRRGLSAIGRGRRCGAVGAALGPGSGSRLENDYLETALIADLPFPVDRGGRTALGGDGPQWGYGTTQAQHDAHAKCSSSPSSSDTGRSHVGHHHTACIGVPHATWRGPAGSSALRAPQPASSRSVSASSRPGVLSS